MNWDQGCENPNFQAESDLAYESLHRRFNGFRSQFPVNTSDALMLLSTGVQGQVPRMFKVWIPPGATRINMNFFAPNGAMVGVATRWKQTPLLNYCAVKSSVWSALPWMSGGAISPLAAIDRQVANQGGSFFPVVDYLRTPLADKGWLYFKVLDADLINDVWQFQYVVQVNRQAYSVWYASTSWDAYGDPSEAAPTPQPQPEPTPTPTPTPGTLKVSYKISGQSLTITLPTGVSWT